MPQEDFLEELASLSTIIYRVTRLFVQGNGKPGQFPTLPKSQFFALMAVRENKRYTMGELAEHLMITKQQMTKIVDALVQKGLVERKSNQENRRHVMIEISEKGCSFVKELLVGRSDILAYVRRYITEEEARQIFDAITTIKTVLAKVPSVAMQEKK